MTENCVPGDDGEQVVEIMGDAGGNASEGLESLHLLLLNRSDAFDRDVRDIDRQPVRQRVDANVEQPSVRLGELNADGFLLSGGPPKRVVDIGADNFGKLVPDHISEKLAAARRRVSSSPRGLRYVNRQSESRM